MAPDPQKIIQKLFELYGGREEAFREFEADLALINKRWNQDIVAIGRILRAHLFVEHFLTEYLVARNPELGSLDKTRLSFVQKLALIGSGTAGVEYLLPGIRHLNVLRNRLVHTLQADVRDDDVHVFLAIDLFRAMREGGSAPNTPSSDPMDVLEDFAKHAGLALHSSATRDSELWAKAIRLAEAE